MPTIISFKPFMVRGVTMQGERLLRTRQVALALGVSVSTIKRWVDSGLLRAQRTVGKHRLIALSDAVRFARVQGLSWALHEPDASDERLHEQLLAALRDGRGREARDLIETIHAANGAVVLADAWIRPVMDRVGHGWADGSVDVYQEHQATQTVSRVLSALIEHATGRSAATGLLALGAGAEGDPYTLALLLGELVLRENGWDVRNLGPNLPLESLASAVQRHRPALVFLSVSFVRDPDRFVHDYARFYDAISPWETAVFLGGRALTRDLRARLACAGFGDRMLHLAEFARRWSARAEREFARGSGLAPTQRVAP